ncbi:hypothetical protein TSTA_008630 [Talaromyces stipitatus ATCC 10500]|uniref:Uncharacterized protein n=1 Tax=Talaromyces stipitatus (strain ATCC 10500 / CBS 375.48 / QM 6759 / NRRL 1006) TaxID=441959 RepID=B8MVB1_TALSN|nr:uncharacterized protein TSTA_008630 [Talaromyces stipitatus ATCC 10500]EED11567.1 hypothetical protein TSTA_008630 [Talaromyces stipitatus ATCC 10500]
MAEQQTCSSCLAEKPLDDFKSKTGNQRKSNDADVSEPPVEDIHVPHFMRPTNASLRRIAPQRLSAQQFIQQTVEQSQQDTPLSSAPSFHFRGAHSQDSPQVAEARRRREQDRRAHRAARRAGEDVPPSQGLDTYIAEQEQEIPLFAQPPSFSTQAMSEAEHDIPPSAQQLPPSTPHAESQVSSTPDHLAVVSTYNFSTPDPLTAIPTRRQYQFCVSGVHEVLKTAFYDDHEIEHDICNSCRSQFVTSMDTDPSFHPVSNAASTQPQGPRKINRRPSRTAPHHDLHQPDPQYIPGETRILSQPALTETDWGYTTVFHNALQQQRMEWCVVCDEKWFNIRLTSDNTCARCLRADKDQDIPLYGVANNMHPGEMPDLPELSQTEEMLIARVHVFVEVRRVRGQNLEIILLRPVNASTDPRLQRQFIHDFRVRRERIIKWLTFLRLNRPGYRDIEISKEALNLLPLDGDVTDQIFNESLDPVQISDSTNTEVVEPPELSAVPDLLAQEDEMTAIRNQLQPEESHQQHMEFPLFRSTPIAEFTRSQPLLSWAFPTLFPRGEGEYIYPRQRTVSFGDYAKHLMKFHDGRFARHPRLRYVVFNTMMRQQANTKASFFVKQKIKDGREITADDLRLAFEDDTPEGEALLNSITRRSGMLRGIRPFWTNKHQHLKAMVKNIAADLHWADLMQHLPNFERAAIGQERIQIARDNLRDNPHIVAQWFWIRSNVFRKEVLDKRFNVIDNWNQFEWQGHGSVHNHGLYWVNGAPNSEVEPLSLELRQAFANFWGIHISALNPQPGQMVADTTERSPIQLEFADQKNTVGFLSRVANRVQRHVCSKKYCFRKEKGSDVVSCRFHFPHSIQTEPFVERAPGHQYHHFYSIRNDAMINAWNRCILMGWLANIDIAPGTGSRALLDYIAKYVSKVEKKTESYKDMMKGFLPKLNPQNPFLSAVSKMMNRLIGERDWSAQEVLHLLLDIPLQSASRICINVDCRPEEVHAAPFVPVEPEIEGDETVQRGFSVLEKYKRRPELFENLSYFTFLREFDFRNWRQIYRRDAPVRVLNYFPLYNSGCS